MFRKHQGRRRQRGSILILFTICLPVLVVITGLAIDCTVMYIAQAQLQTAVDGAARGGVRLLGTNANITEIAGEFLTANMPGGYWWSGSLTNQSTTLTVTGNKNTVTSNATVKVPLFFMRFFGSSSTTVAATSNASAWQVIDCGLTYPSGSAPALSSVPFSESQVMVGYGPAFLQPHGEFVAWYNDEHPITLGIREVQVISSSSGSGTPPPPSGSAPPPPPSGSAPPPPPSGSTTGTTTTTTDYTFPLFSGTLYTISNSGPLSVGTTAMTGNQAGTDTAVWNNTYGYLDTNRPMWPAAFVTDITLNSSATSGDWQMGGTGAIPPIALYGSWKGAVRTVDTTQSPYTITVTPDSDPSSQYQWQGIPDTPTGGFPSSAGYGAEVVWTVDSLGFQSGHTYRVQIMIHDGDQNGSGGDVGEGCAVASY